MTGTSTTGDVAERNTRAADTQQTPAGKGFSRRWPVVAPAALLAAFGILLVLVLARPNFATGFDTTVRNAVERTAHMPQDRRHFMIFKAFAAFGHAEIALPGLVAFAGLTALVRRSWRPVLAAVFAGAVLGAAIVPLKIGIARPGPVPGPLEGGFGYFPSGHTADTLMCYGTCALILAGGLGPIGGGRTWRRVIAAAAVLQALLVGFSLVWLDYHWVTDVLGSYTLCGAALFAVAWILGMFKRPEPETGAAHVA